MMTLMMVGLILTELLATAILVIGTIFYFGCIKWMIAHPFLSIQVLLTKTSFS